MSVIGAAPVAPRSIPGTNAITIDPGLKPSLRFVSLGSIGTPEMLRGIAATGRWRRRPVGESASATV